MKPAPRRMAAIMTNLTTWAPVIASDPLFVVEPEVFGGVVEISAIGVEAVEVLGEMGGVFGGLVVEIVGVSGGVTGGVSGVPGI